VAIRGDFGVRTLPRVASITKAKASSPARYSIVSSDFGRREVWRMMMSPCWFRPLIRLPSLNSPSSHDSLKARDVSTSFSSPALIRTAEARQAYERIFSFVGGLEVGGFDMMESRYSLLVLCS